VTDGQSLASQDAQLHAAGCAKVFREKVSGAKTGRAELAKVLKCLESGDVLVVTRLDRLDDRFLETYHLDPYLRPMNAAIKAGSI
jgi:DNA invertase Pin-like site-specific DNA recombinase